MIILATILLIQISGLSITRSKNMYIVNGSYSLTNVSIVRVNTEYTPSKVSLTFSLQNQIPGMNTQFDLFYYLDQSDLDCYQNVIGNESYLRPCSFVQNNYTILKATGVDKRGFENMGIQQLNSLNFYVIVDNTRYPYPDGAYSYQNISLLESVEFDVRLSDLYENIGIKLIYVNCTLYLIYGVIIGVLVYKERKNTKLVQDTEQIAMAEQQSQDSEQQQFPIELNRTMRQSEQYESLASQYAR